MGSLLSYSGLTTKIRAMQSRLLTDDQYRELAELKSVPQAVTYLKQQPAYEAILDSLSEEALHRGKIEQLLVNSIYRDFTKIYQFSNMEQRKFLNLYFGRYEVSIMKECLNKIFDHRDVNLDLSLFKPFFDKHSQLDINLLTASRSIEEFVSHLRGTSYYQPLAALSGLETLTSLWFVFFFLAILSISSIKIIPCSARSTSLSAAASSLETTLSISSPI